MNEVKEKFSTCSEFISHIGGRRYLWWILQQATPTGSYIIKLSKLDESEPWLSRNLKEIIDTLSPKHTVFFFIFLVGVRLREVCINSSWWRQQDVTFLCILLWFAFHKADLFQTWVSYTLYSLPLLFIQKSLTAFINFSNLTDLPLL